MYKVIFFFLTFSLFVFASEDVFVFSQSNQILDKYQKTFLSDDNSLKPYEMNEDLFQKREKNVFGRTKKTVYSKLIILNDTNISHTFVLVNPRVGIDFLDIWVFKNNILDKQFLIGDMRPLKNRERISRYSVCEISLLPNESVKVFSKIYSTTNGVLESNWLMLEKNEFDKNTQNDLLWWGLYSGILIALIFYNFIYFTIIKDKAFLIHTIYAVTSFITYLALYEIFYYLDFTDNFLFLNELSYLGVYFSMILQMVLPLYFFNISKTNYKKIYYFLKFMIAIFSLLLIAYIGRIFHLFPIGFDIGSVFFAIGLVGNFIIVLYLVLQKEVGSFYYMFAKIFLIGSVFFTSYVVYGGFKESIFIASSITSFFILGEIFFITLALSTKVKTIKNQKENLEKIATLQNRYTHLGEYITFIVHQWRRPVSSLGAVVSNMKFTLQHDTINKNELLENLEDLQKITNDFNIITKEIHEQLSSNEDKEIVNLYDAIQKALNYFRNENLEVKYIFPNLDLIVNTYPASLNQLLIIFISNAINIFKLRDIKTPIITFIYKPHQLGFILTIKDNGGGVEKKVFKDIFTPLVSTTKEGFGIGLYIAIQIIQKKFEGTINIKNDKEGAAFDIVFKI
ncbi:MAG: sensor histidine kinase [Arcobacteraceae bacterium]|nr:sensor histidine kinase [Arcobacteraceae bacterium]